MNKTSRDSTQILNPPKKTKWTAQDDRTLLLFARMRVIDAREYGVVSEYLTCEPSSEEIQKRLQDLREEQISKLKKGGILGDKGLGEVQEARPERHGSGGRAGKLVEAEGGGGEWGSAEHDAVSGSGGQASSFIPGVEKGARVAEGLDGTGGRIVDGERAASKRLRRRTDGTYVDT
ncbi:hypothetical protein Tdes44962_MAKER03167 [Teratosphaeria destructans]|uniref:Uncharacterized protein n=1 Tax=Teratosphaeria destructans TaxID=418781 RepID=A0A9W7SQT5_9PEZI|nr:hypothetical protein Tdes44962_MAKER03167 [Teratosphaeria destructans]